MTKTMNEAASLMMATANMRALLKTVTYKPGWHLDVCHINDHPHIRITASVPDSENPDQVVPIAHVLPFPDYGVLADVILQDNRSTRRWVYDMILAVERHELGEWLRFGDDRPFYPSHDGAPDRYDEPPRHDHLCSEQCAASDEHMAAMDADAWRQINELEER